MKPDRCVSLAALALAGAMLAASADAAALDVIAAQTLARQSGCLQCHSVYQKKIGPAWKDVAAKYHGEPDAEQRLYQHVTTGRKAKFDDGHTEDHPIVKTSDPKRVEQSRRLDPRAAGRRAGRRQRRADARAPEQVPQVPCGRRQEGRAGVEGRRRRSIWTIAGAEDKLYKHVTTGRKAKFADGHEESHPIVKTRDPDRINNLVDWILSLK